VLQKSRHTTRISVVPLAVRWRVAEVYDARLGDVLLAVRNELATGSTWLVAIDLASGAERAIALPPMPPPNGSSRYELGGGTILGTSATEVDVAVSFGYLE
jgi:hypothetical protein